MGGVHCFFDRATAYCGRLRHVAAPRGITSAVNAAKFCGCAESARCYGLLSSRACSFVCRKFRRVRHWHILKLFDVSCFRLELLLLLHSGIALL